MKPLCIYHGNCADGFGAAWAVWKKHPEWEFHAGVHQDPPPDISGRDVVIVDFSYKRAVLKKMVESAQSILILDHHKSAKEDLAGIAPAPDLDPDQTGWSPIQGAYATFDMERSGAGITWDHFHGPHTRPALINHIEDRDLWRFNLPKTREIQAAVFSYPYDFEVWDQLMRANLAELAREGEAIERKHHKDIKELVGVCKRYLMIGGHKVPVASLPYTLTSDAGHLMCNEPRIVDMHGPHFYPFAACYWDTPEGRVFSLRSVDHCDGIDVSEVAAQYGGGGHKNAAGFRLSLEEAREFELSGEP